MPSQWEWYAGIVGEPIYEVACGCASREEAIAEALRNVSADEQIQIIEAQSSTAKKYEGADWVPFVKTRNHEIIATERNTSAGLTKMLNDPVIAKAVNEQGGGRQA